MFRAGSAGNQRKENVVKRASVIRVVTYPKYYFSVPLHAHHRRLPTSTNPVPLTSSPIRM